MWTCSKPLNTSRMMAVGVLLTALLISAACQAQLNWSSIKQYQAPARLLHYPAPNKPVGTLLIWPEFKQTHHWLSLAQAWQQRGWQVFLLKPSQQQLQFDPSSEQVPTSQNQWLTQRAEQLNQVLPKPFLLSDTHSNNTVTELSQSKKKVPSPLVVLTQGSASLWYQQLVDSEAIARPQALILFDALPRESSEQQMLAISLARSPYPILDIYSRPDNPLAWHNQQRRQQQLQQREKTGYAVQHFNDLSVLNKQIAGWLVRLGWLPLPPSAPQYLKE
ncbi:DUF3530 family protein [Oceanisphaera pacifica]|uniref:DUF3530 family protein n=1 Tax=Oceanisphaera pacifica TaxID=2818389 RepID=A0ABS3NC28_9GAMM|nr:DUF3530 family protein [Oceanisphaera pacifica]MBO1518037.1 DUF3530 family protein [Oceanisphaera pacifica]